MAEEQQPKEVIEIITHPEGGRMELAKMANSMLAINADYRRWLKEEEELSPNDPALKLYVERVEQGSVDMWLGQFKDVGISLIKYGLNFFQKAVSPEKSIEKWSKSQQQNMLKFFSNNIGSKMEVNIGYKGGDNIIVNGNVFVIASEKFEQNRDFVKEYLATRKENREKTPIRFIEYNTEKGTARIIACDVDKYSSYEAELLVPVSTFLSADLERVLIKEYTANITVRRMADSGNIHSYIVREIVVPEPSENSV